MSNHQSFFDVFVLLSGIPTEFKFVLKKELMKIFPLGIAMRKVGQISIDRHSSKNAADSLNRAAAKMKAGISVLIFPEGTRSPDGRLGAFKKGGFHLALKSGCEIVPVAVKDTCRIAPKGSHRINKFRAALIMGSPIPVKGLHQRDIPELAVSIRSAILDMLGQRGEPGE
jgi:1-acyl-sn-glycerol-3-phosphate acyltransferase